MTQALYEHMNNKTIKKNASTFTMVSCNWVWHRWASCPWGQNFCFWEQSVSSHVSMNKLSYTIFFFFRCIRWKHQWNVHWRGIILK
jgi:hypothetical protein